MSGEEEPVPGNAPAPIVFRKKKPKSIRQRAAADAEDNDRISESETQTATEPASAEQQAPGSALAALLKAVDGRHPGGGTHEEAKGDREAKRREEEAPALSELLRQRRKQQHRPKGVEFRVERLSEDDGKGEMETGGGNAERSIALRGAQATTQEVPTGGLLKRFAPQMGLRSDLVNKHMEAYVESKFTKRGAPAHPFSSPPSSMYATNATTQTGTSRRTQITHDLSSAPPPLAGSSAAGLEVLKPTMQGKLMEVDLGDEARARTIALTEKAKRRLAGESLDEDEATTGPRPGKRVRLGPDGKPWRSRNRRGSDDVKRDQIVEAFMHENKLDVYDVSSQDQIVGDPDTDQDADEGTTADDRLANMFRKEYDSHVRDKIARNRARARQRQANARPGDYNKKGDGEVLRGPKLGGSRNDRAQMRDLLLRQEKETQGRR